MKTILSAAIGAMLALSIMEAGAQNRIAERKVELTIEQQSLADALNEWAKQTGLQLVSSSSEMMNTTVAPQIKGAYTAQGALEELLKGTTLTYEWVSDRAVAIREKSPIVPASLQPGEADKKEVVVPIARLSSETWGDRRVAANDQGATGAASPAGRRGDRDLPDLEELEEIVVTGTHIAGSASAGSRVITLNRDDIANSGYATVEGLMKTVPQNFNGGVSEGQSDKFGSNSGNAYRGTAVNLRGLGPDSTLSLVDGRRQPAGGVTGSFVDISTIPTSAIERVEILPDGASALYGSDAVAGVVNFVLRKNFDGAESQLRYGGADGGADQLQFSQVFGHNWSTGNVIVGYQYDDRGNLRRDQRAYSASNDLTPLGGSDYRMMFSNPGNILCPFGRPDLDCVPFQPAFAIPRGQDGTSLQPADLLPGVTNFGTSSSSMDLFGSKTIHSAFVNVGQRVGDGSEVFASGRFSRRKDTNVLTPEIALLVVPSSNPFFVDPFGGSAVVFVPYDLAADLGLKVSTSSLDTYVGTLGTTVELPADWQVSLSGTYGREEGEWIGHNLLRRETFGGAPIALLSALADPNPATAFNPFGDGSHTSSATLSAIQQTLSNVSASTSRNANAILTGPLFRIGEARSMLAFGVDFRDEDTSLDTRTDSDSLQEDWGRHVKAAFAELAFPLITSGPHPGLRDLSVSLAGRYEDYSDFGTTFNEKVGITWGPTESVKVRGTWGTSFKAPLLSQLSTANLASTAGFTVLPSPDGPVDALFRAGNNPDLKEETAEVWSVGFDWKPNGLPGASTSLTFWNVAYKDRVARPGPPDDETAVLFEADQWAESINFNPTREQVDAICRDPSYFIFPDNPVTPEQCLTMMPSVVVDLRLTNLARVSVQGIDAEAQYQFDTRAGAISLGLNGVYTSSYDRQASARSLEVDGSNTTGNLLRLRLRGEASWRRGGWDVGAFVNYANSYEDTFSVSGRSVKAWTTVDGSVSYRFEDSKEALNGLTVALNALNIFDRDPPFANVGIPNVAHGYDTANANPLGRVLTLQVRKIWGGAR